MRASSVHTTFAGYARYMLRLGASAESRLAASTKASICIMNHPPQDNESPETLASASHAAHAPYPASGRTAPSSRQPPPSPAGGDAAFTWQPPPPASSAARSLSGLSRQSLHPSIRESTCSCLSRSALPAGVQPFHLYCSATADVPLPSSRSYSSASASGGSGEASAVGRGQALGRWVNAIATVCIRTGTHFGGVGFSHFPAGTG